MNGTGEQRDERTSPPTVGKQSTGALVGVAVVVLVIAWAMVNLTAGTPWRWTTLVITCLPVVYVILVGSYWRTRRQAKERMQFGLGLVMLTIAVFAVWLATARKDYSDLRWRTAERARLTVLLNKLFGTRNEVLGDRLWLEVADGKPFGDDELSQLLDMQPLLRLAGMHIERLDLGQSDVTDNAVARLAEVRTLEAILLYETAVTDAGVEPLLDLPRLHLLDVAETGVSKPLCRRFRERRPGITLRAP